MKTPRFLLGAALIFWGCQNDLLIWSIPMALLLEATHFTRGRWELSLTDLNRIWNLCAVLFGGLLLVLYTSEERSRLAFKFGQWLPFAFLPIMLAQAYGTWEKMPLSVFSWFLRRAPENPMAKQTVNVSYFYLTTVLLGASAADRDPDVNNAFFYPGIVILLGLTLWSFRPKRISIATWLVTLGLIAAAGEVSHEHLHRMQVLFEGQLTHLLSGLFGWRRSDPERNRTFIGEIGRLKLSGRIVIRVQPEGSPPAYLREASYDHYVNGMWRTSSNSFLPLSVGTNDIAYLQPPKKFAQTTHISRYLPGGKGLLPLPHGAFELDELPLALWSNRFGVVKSDAGPGFVNFIAQYGSGTTLDEPPGTNDLDIPSVELPAIEQIADDLKFSEKTERERIQAIEKFFQENFKYSLELGPWRFDRTGKTTPLARFLTITRKGHCEYFATATVLLLRQAGIPARYAVGYGVEESSRNGGTYLVRERHAHAWVLLWRQSKKHWENFDTTPGGWDQSDAQHASWWEPITDFGSNLMFQFSKWRWSKTSFLQYLQWLLIPLIGYLAWRIISVKRRKKLAAAGQQSALEPAWPGLDSELFQLEHQLAESELGRRPNEPLAEWRKRIGSKVPARERLDGIFHLHYRLRFDPQGLSGADRQVLRQETEIWLEEFRRNNETLSATKR